MPYQSQSNGYIAFKAQSGLGAGATGAGATLLRTTGGQGGRLTKATYGSNEVRQDGMRTRGRHGGRRTSGPYTCEWSLGLADEILQAVMRGTWGAANLAKTEADFTSITTGANSIVLASGSPIAMGFRVGEVIRLSNHSSAGNNNRNLRITALDPTTITVAETLTVNAVADTSVTITRTGRVLTNPAARIKRYFTIEEHELDIDGSEVFEDCVWGAMKFTMQPNGMLMFEPSWVGTGVFEALTGGAAPLFTAPVEPTGVPMSCVDAVIRVGSADVIDLTAFDITIDAKAAPPDPGVIASTVAPDVFTGTMDVSMNLTALRKDLQYVADFAAETVYSLHVLAVDNESEPKDFLSIHVPNFTFGSADKSALSREGGARTQTIAIPADLVGIDTRGGAYDATMVKFQVSNAA